MIKGYQLLLFAGIILVILFILARAIVQRYMAQMPRDGQQSVVEDQIYI